MGIIKEFKEFTMRGNVLDLAVGVIIGGAFGTIVPNTNTTKLEANCIFLRGYNMILDTAVTVIHTYLKA